MKQGRTFIVVSSIALLLLLALQIKWLVDTARIKEQLFNEKANMVLSRTAETLGGDKETCQKMGKCCVLENMGVCKLQLEKSEVNKIDSLLKKFMAFYHFKIDYSFEVLKPVGGLGSNRKIINNNVFVQHLEEAAFKNGLELKLIFPEKKQFILAEMGPVFISSVLLVLVLMVLFAMSIRSYYKEKELASHLNDFLNNMTHEFKTPLTNIALSTKMLRKDANIKEESKVLHYSDIILQENEKLRLQVEQVLGMTAFERGEIPMNKQLLDVHQLLNETMRCMNLQLESVQGEFDLHLGAAHSTVYADKTHLSNALCNVIDNAIKYSPGAPKIKIETENAAGLLSIRVMDQGLGISAEHQKKVFDKFYRVPTGNLHDVKGFGLGLAYVKKIIGLHGGSTHLESRLGSGSTFTIELPLSE